ncbi:MAG: hypothetical protein J6O23_02010 [Prevotella sp.]|nr:hypothetical protein [Prevotella sp.]
MEEKESVSMKVTPSEEELIKAIRNHKISDMKKRMQALKTLILALKDSAAAFIALLMYNNFIAKWNAEF